MVVVRSWHSAAVTAVLPSFAATVAAFMTWTPAPAAAAATAAPARPASAAAVAGAAVAAGAAATGAATSQPATLLPHQQHAVPAATGTLGPQSVLQAGASSAAAGSPERRAAPGPVGVFYNHPNQGCYVPSLPQLLVLAFRPCMGQLGAEQRAMVGQVLQFVARQQDISSTGGGQLQPTLPQGLGEFVLVMQCHSNGCWRRRWLPAVEADALF